MIIIIRKFIEKFRASLRALRIFIRRKREKLRIHKGMAYFVDSKKGKNYPSEGRGLSPDKPFKTVSYSIKQCVANREDVIYILPGGL